MRSMAISLILLTVGACQGPSPDSPADQTSVWPTPEPGATPKVLLVGLGR